MDQASLGQLLALLPEPYAKYAAALVIFCKLAVVFWRPPAPGSRLALLYRCVNILALNVGWAVNAYQVGKKALMIPVDAPHAIREQAAAAAGVPVSSTQPSRIIS